MLEKVVADRLQAHIKKYHLSNTLQSAYRKLHSTESTLLKLHSDILITVDKSVVTALTFFDLSTAFDTIDHATLTDSTFRLVWNIWAGSNLVFFSIEK